MSLRIIFSGKQPYSNNLMMKRATRPNVSFKSIFNEWKINLNRKSECLKGSWPKIQNGKSFQLDEREKVFCLFCLSWKNVFAFVLTTYWSTNGYCINFPLFNIFYSLKLNRTTQVRAFTKMHLKELILVVENCQRDHYNRRIS